MIDHALRDQLKDVHAYALTIYQRDDLYALDLDGFARNIAWAADRGVRVFVVAGGTGENDALAPPERLTLAECALATVGERALVVPTLPGNLGEAADLAPRYEALGLRVALAMAPYTRHQVPEDPEGVYQYYEALGTRSGLALMPYNTQGWSAELFERLAAVPQIAAIKDPCVEPHQPLSRHQAARRPLRLDRQQAPRSGRVALSFSGWDRGLYRWFCQFCTTARAGAFRCRATTGLAADDRVAGAVGPFGAVALAL